jgi:chemotaxis protein CheC
MIELSELHRDALGEIFNIGVGRAADGLSQLVKNEVLLSSPSVSFCQPETAHKDLLGAKLSKLSAVSQDYSGPFDAKAMLVFPEIHALEIVRLMVGANDLSIDEISEFAQEALCEVGNIILNACMSALADIFHVVLEGDLPVHHFGDSQTLIGSHLSKPDEAPTILLLQVDMSISDNSIHGQIVFLMSITSLATLIQLVDRYLSEQGLI